MRSSSKLQSTKMSLRPIQTTPWLGPKMRFSASTQRQSSMPPRMASIIKQNQTQPSKRNGRASKNDRWKGKCSRMAGIGCLRARKWVKGNKSSEKKGMAGRKNRGESGNDGAGLRGPAKSTGGVYNVDSENSCDRIVRRIVVHWNARNVVRAAAQATTRQAQPAQPARSTAQPARSTKTAAGDAVDQRKSNGYWRPLLHLGNGYRWEHAVCGR